MLLSLGVATTIGCGPYCEKPNRNNPKDPKDHVIVVEKSEIIELEDGSFKVSKGWMQERMAFEQELMDSLNYCLQGTTEK